MRRIESREVFKVCKAKGYKVFQNSRRPFNLNIFGVRSKEPVVDEFNCAILLIWRDNQRGWQRRQYSATTLPGRYYLINRLLNKKGCAILAPGQYRGAYAIGKHKDRFTALVQEGLVKVFRDGNRDNEFDYNLGNSDVGYFGINIHRAGRNGVTPKVGKYSAGCQVFQSSKDFNEFITFIQMGLQNWGNRFTYTLLEESEIDELLQ